MIRISIFNPDYSDERVPAMYMKESDLQNAAQGHPEVIIFDEIGDFVKNFNRGTVYTFAYRLLLRGEPVEELDASLWKMHVLTDEEERDNIIKHYESMFKNEPNKSWQIIPMELPA